MDKMKKKIKTKFNRKNLRRNLIKKNIFKFGHPLSYIKYKKIIKFFFVFLVISAFLCVLNLTNLVCIRKKYLYIFFSNVSNLTHWALTSFYCLRVFFIFLIY